MARKKSQMRSKEENDAVLNKISEEIAQERKKGKQVKVVEKEESSEEESDSEEEMAESGAEEEGDSEVEEDEDDEDDNEEPGGEEKDENEHLLNVEGDDEQEEEEEYDNDSDFGAEEAEEYGPNAEGSTAFGRAFEKIMKRKVPDSELTEISGPVLAERKKLLVRKFEEEEEAKEKKTGKDEKREERERGHVIPLSYTDAKEKSFIKLATKGVVQLFNAVSKSQSIQANADISSSKKAKETLKRSKAVFNSELHANRGLKINQAEGNPVQEQNEIRPGWAALREDFMLGSSKKLMDWDKNLVDDIPVD